MMIGLGLQIIFQFDFWSLPSSSPSNDDAVVDLWQKQFLIVFNHQKLRPKHQIIWYAKFVTLLSKSLNLFIQQP